METKALHLYFSNTAYQLSKKKNNKNWLLVICSHVSLSGNIKMWAETFLFEPGC